jgi:hypothetical protein
MAKPGGPLLLSAQVALSLMIFANVAFNNDAHLRSRKDRPTNLADVFWFRATGGRAMINKVQSSSTRVFESLPGVIAACVSNAIPQTRADFVPWSRQIRI